MKWILVSANNNGGSLRTECLTVAELRAYDDGARFLWPMDAPNLYQLSEPVSRIRAFFGGAQRSETFHRYQEWLFDRAVACENTFLSLTEDQMINIKSDWPDPVEERTWAIRDKPSTFWRHYYREDFLSRQGDWMLYQILYGTPVKASLLESALVSKKGEGYRIMGSLRTCSVQFLIFSFPDDDRWLLALPKAGDVKTRNQ